MEETRQKQLRILFVDEDESILGQYRKIFLSESCSGPNGSESAGDLSDPRFAFDPVFGNRDEAVGKARSAIEENRPFAVAFLCVREPDISNDIITAEMIREEDPNLEIGIVGQNTENFAERISRRILPSDKLMFFDEPLRSRQLLHAATVMGSKWDAERRLRELNRNDGGNEYSVPGGNEIYRSFLEYLPAPAFIKDKNGRYVYANRAYGKAFNTDPADRIGKTDKDIWPPKIAENFRKNDLIVLNEKKMLGTVDVFTRKKDTRYYYTVQFPIIINGVPFFIAGVSLELPDKIHSGLEFLNNRDKKRNLEVFPESKALTHFLISGRTHMNGIIGMCDLIRNAHLTSEQREYFKILHVSALSMLELINNINDFSRLESDRLELENKPFSLKKALEDIRNTFHDDVAGKQIELTIDIAEDVPDRLIADPMRLRQVLVNLTSNALRFTEEGEIGISVKLEPSENTDVIRPLFAVRDTGIGITSEIRDSLFDIFTNDGCDYALKKYGGAGLGLTICKRIVNLMGGGIRVESEPGEGSSFYFTIEAKIDESPAPPENKTPKNTSETKEIRVLLAEDHPVNRRVAVEILKNAGVLADIAVNGVEAVEAVQREKYDAVLMDVQMPVMNGIEATRVIRGKLGIADLPIIAVTARDMYGDRRKCIDAGMNDYIAKPVDREKLLGGLRRNLFPESDSTEFETPLEPDTEDGHADEIPDLPGLNVKEGLARLSGDWDLYADLVVFLCDDKKDFCPEIKELVENKDFENAMVKAHSLKGSAATVGATELCEASRELEAACEDKETDRIADALSKVETAFALVASSAKKVADIQANTVADESETEPPRADEETDIGDLVSKLDVCFRDSDPVESGELLKQLRNATAERNQNSRIIPLIDEMTSLSGNYQFEKALGILGKLATELET